MKPSKLKTLWTIYVVYPLLALISKFRPKPKIEDCCGCGGCHEYTVYDESGTMEPDHIQQLVNQVWNTGKPVVGSVDDQGNFTMKTLDK